LIPSNSLIHSLGFFDWERNRIDWKRFEHLDLSSLSRIKAENCGEEAIEGLLTLLLRSNCEALAIEWTIYSGESLKAFFTHTVMKRVVRLDLKLRE
jgi:hypothetical protein